MSVTVLTTCRSGRKGRPPKVTDPLGRTPGGWTCLSQDGTGRTPTHPTITRSPPDPGHLVVSDPGTSTVLGVRPPRSFPRPSPNTPHHRPEPDTLHRDGLQRRDLWTEYTCFWSDGVKGSPVNLVNVRDRVTPVPQHESHPPT